MSKNNPFSDLLSNRQFNWLFLGNTSLFFGFFGSILLRSLLAWEITNDELALGYVNLVSAICMFGSSLVAGTLVDRFERRNLLLIAQSVVFFAELAILLLLAVDQLSFVLLILCSTATSIAFPFIMPVRTAMLVDTVGKSKLGRATALVTTGVNLARMVSPAMVGIFADSLGFVFCYLFLISLHAASLLFTIKIQRFERPAVVRQSFVKETLDGFTYIFKNPSMGLCILFGVVPLLLAVPLQNLMVVFVEELWHHGGSGLGIMMAMMGLGGLLGSLVMPLVSNKSMVKPMVFSTLAMAGLVVVFAYTPNFWAATVVILFAYAASVLSNTLVTTAVQLMAEDHIRGRVTTISLMSVSLSPLGTIPMAFATKEYGATAALTVGGSALAVMVLAIWLLIPAFRRIDKNIDHDGHKLKLDQ